MLFRSVVYDTEFFEGLSDVTRNKKPIVAIDVVLRTLSEHKTLFPDGVATKQDIFSKHERSINYSKPTRAAIWKHPAVKQLEIDGLIKMHTKYIEFLK